ncbi:CinA family nicotinamide mononucleotide deamidase-related protein [Photobacterium sp. DNB23_23_1]|uniref:CinA-like protein n=1 Tax=Photobacterium pectinilyticum TaxID=2906793 RepID=A0ABT1MZ73_9GAMM|nr:CinA family nicotinamide mononucleotide deamidase-related protein [Photobacterium sp. ZSDE20]MCQ1057694.1 CinA family nicotinamide mononucleotide deamidase-related protein [Photobacterium sp. ZSDE20]MDD1822095.1 CinA family nicotinamide mononucleotide deamidase-related protein [Photobacterium sp. ZSDE20]
MLKVAMISTGEEVLHGDITDTNAAWMSALFFQRGFPLSRRTTVGDQLDMLAKEIEHCSLTADVVIVNGGLGPTTDDLTAQAAAVAADVGLELVDEWVVAMEEKYAQLGRVMPETNLKQAMLPEGAEVLDNPVGTACGFAMQINRAWIFFTPGVPSEFKKMTHEQILPRLESSYANDSAQECIRLYTFGLSESGIGQSLQSICLPDGFELGYRSEIPFIEVKVFCPQGHQQTPVLVEAIASELGDNLVGHNQPLLAAVGELVEGKGHKIAIAEQYTGGFLTSWLYDDERLAGFISQSWILGSDSVIEGDAKAPIEASLSMAQVARDKNRADIGLAIGAEQDGYVVVALVTPEGEWAQQVATKRRYSSRDYRYVLATLGLDMLRRWLEDKPIFGHSESLQRIAQVGN